MNYNKIVCYDLEMCCWENQSPGEIIEIGVAEVNLITRKITRTSQYYCKPDHDEISAFCTKLTGITPQKIEKMGRPLSQVLQSLANKYGSSNALYAAWGRDDRVIAKECLNKQLPCPIREHLNIATLYNIHYRYEGDRRSLTETLLHHGMEFEGRQHSGLDDAINLAKLTLTLTFL